MLRAVIHASEVLTGAGVREKDGRRVKESDLGRIEDGALVYQTKSVDGREIPDQLVWVGPTRSMPDEYSSVPAQDLKNRKAVCPGLIDCHNHLVFAGDRSKEFALRCAGATYEEIAKNGGGILSTIHPTREASEQELEDLAVDRIKESMGFGVKTLEIKSGYGLSIESELKCLRVIQKLKARFPELTIQSTFLGAHAFPPDQTRKDYLADLLDQMLPQVVEEELADACDVFIDDGYYTLDEGRRILEKARSLGLKIKVHADELVNTESAALAAELGALSADHLLQISEKGIRALAQSNTVGVLLPGTAFYLKAEYAPARTLIDAGVCVALATDFNPGSCACNSLPVMMTLGALYMGMSRAEVFSAVTYGAAKALGLEESKGTLEPGKDADFSILPFASFEEVYYRFAWTPVS